MASESVESVPGRVSAYRWIVLVLVVTATIINYLDRQIIALLKPLIEVEYGWSDTDYGHVVSAFQFSAALAYLGAGWFIDRLGLRWGYAIAVGAWTLAAIAHAAARNVTDFVMARVALGVAEAGNTPAAVKAVASWFPPRERALALGFMNAGSNSGAIFAPLVVPPLALALGWRWAFVLTGATGVIWLIGWLAVRRKPPYEQAAPEGAPAGAPAARIKWGPLLRDRRTWVVAGAKLLTDPVWWFMLFWLPDLLVRVFHLDLRTFGVPIATVYSMAIVGALGGGWLAGRMMAGGASLNRARKTTMLLCALVVLPTPLVLSVDNYWYAVAIIGLTLAGHQGFSTNVFALATDMFPQQMVGTVVGIGALFGNIGGLAILEITGWVLDRTGSYLPVFIYCGGAYLAAWVLIHLLAPRIVGHDGAATLAQHAH
jgi:ACS family hexuronate transporter-like MFS transporter